MANTYDVISVVEAAYSLDSPDDLWLRGILRCAAAGVPGGPSLIGALFDLERPAPIGDVLESEGCPPDLLAMATQFVAFANTAGAGVREVFSRTHCQTHSGLLRESWRSQAQIQAQYERALSPGDSVGVIGVNPDGTGVLLTTFLPEPTRLPLAVRQHWERVAAHLASGLRLRRALRRFAAGSPNADGAEAVLAADGRMEHGNGEATQPSSRNALRQAVLAIGRARAGLRRHDPDAALRLWRCLADGRWTLLDHFESDGRRYVLAQRNDPNVPDPRALTLRERQVLAYVAQGHSDKLIGYELGLSRSTVAAYLHAVRRKLGARSRADLIRMGRTAHLHVEPPPENQAPDASKS